MNAINMKPTYIIRMAYNGQMHNIYCGVTEHLINTIKKLELDHLIHVDPTYVNMSGRSVRTLRAVVHDAFHNEPHHATFIYDTFGIDKSYVNDDVMYILLEMCGYNKTMVTCGLKRYMEDSESSHSVDDLNNEQILIEI